MPDMIDAEKESRLRVLIVVYNPRPTPMNTCGAIQASTAVPVLKTRLLFKDKTDARWKPSNSSATLYALVKDQMTDELLLPSTDCNRLLCVRWLHQSAIRQTIRNKGIRGLEPARVPSFHWHR